MALWNSVKAWLRRETADLKEATGDLERQLDADLSERERRLHETPSEAMERLQAEIARNDDALRDLGAQLDRAPAGSVDPSGSDDPDDPDDLDRGSAAS